MVEAAYKLFINPKVSSGQAQVQNTIIKQNLNIGNEFLSWLNIHNFLKVYC